MECDQCAEEQFITAGYDRGRRQHYRCTTCRPYLADRTAFAFCDSRFPDDINVLAVGQRTLC